MSKISHKKLIRNLLKKLEHIPRNTSRLLMIDRILNIPGIDEYKSLHTMLKQDRTDTINEITRNEYNRELAEEKEFFEILNNYIANDVKI